MTSSQVLCGVCPEQALNAYCDDVASGRRPAAARLEFFVREADGVLGRVEAPLPAHGSLGPLFLAFGLITEEELRQGAGTAELGASCNALGGVVLLPDCQPCEPWHGTRCSQCSRKSACIPGSGLRPGIHLVHHLYEQQFWCFITSMMLLLPVSQLSCPSKRAMC